ncbi:MAG: Smr/MutS family protein [Bacilli bacterium]|nr:Smr/MutS family protein [Bacilli bacterium]
MITSNTPTIDLHGEPRDIARILINDFILDNYKLHKKEVIIIHGKGKNILLKETKETLKNNKYVLEYKQDNFNPGETIVKLKYSK